MNGAVDKPSLHNSINKQKNSMLLTVIGTAKVHLFSYKIANMENKKSKQKNRPNPKLKLMEQVHEVLRYHHYAYKTEQTYSQWILRYVHFFECKIHPAQLGARDIERFLSYALPQLCWKTVQTLECFRSLWGTPM